MKNENLVIVVIIAVILIFLVGNFLPFYGGMISPYGMMAGYYYSAWMPLFMMVIWILIIVALALFILWIVQQLQNNSNNSRGKR